MGFVHVLTGPDHLSAIATLSVNVGNFRAFWYGVRWGVGHSIGLVLVGSVFLVLENIHYNSDNDPQKASWVEDSDTRSSNSNENRVVEVPKLVENLAESFVGVFMLVLGLHNLYWARRKRTEKTTCNGKHRHDRDHEHNHWYSNLSHGHSQCHHPHCHYHHVHHEDEEQRGELSCDSLTATASAAPNYGNGSSSPQDNQEENVETEDLKVSKSPSVNSMGIDKATSDANDDGISKKLLSLWIGIFHGVAGPGGVLGVVPAVKLHNLWHSVAYLGSFCASSIVVMGSVAALYGSWSATVSQENDRLAYGLEVASAALSVLVGCTWLILLYLGILDDVFP